MRLLKEMSQAPLGKWLWTMGDGGRWLQGWKDVLNVMYNVRRNGGDLGNQLLIVLEFGEALGLLTLSSEIILVGG